MNTEEKTSARTKRKPKAFRQAILDNLYFSRGSAIQSASHHDVYVALALTVRDHLIERWAKTTQAHYDANPKFVYYLSAEYLLGKQLPQNLLYTDTATLTKNNAACPFTGVRAVSTVTPSRSVPKSPKTPSVMVGV